MSAYFVSEFEIENISTELWPPAVFDPCEIVSHVHEPITSLIKPQSRWPVVVYISWLKLTIVNLTDIIVYRQTKIWCLRFCIIFVYNVCHWPKQNLPSGQKLALTAAQINKYILFMLMHEISGMLPKNRLLNVKLDMLCDSLLTLQFPIC